jgi:hypothetical protein
MTIILAKIKTEYTSPNGAVRKVFFDTPPHGLLLQALRVCLSERLKRRKQPKRYAPFTLKLVRIYCIKIKHKILLKYT